MQHDKPQSETDANASDPPLLCHRCGAMLQTGHGEFYIVRINAIADPTPPSMDGDESATEMAADYELLIAQMSDMSERELMDQVHRQMTIHLCTPCYGKWIDNPTG